MNKNIKIYIAVLAVLLALVLISDNSQKPIDWRESYAIKDKIPFGMYIFDQESKKLLADNSIKKITETPYEYLDKQYIPDSTDGGKYGIKGTVISIGKNVPIDSESWKEIFYFVSHGNTAFISAADLPQIFTDSLKTELDVSFKYNNKPYNSVANSNLGTQKYNLEEGVNTSYFIKFDTINSQVLGYLKTDTTHVNFIRTKFGNGQFILHLQPAAFTNFHLLKGNHYQYAEKVISYIPEGNIYWFLNSNPEESISDSPMRYIFSQPALKWAFIFFLIGLLIFILFNAKRRQRIVPILQPLPNLTVDFTKTIGNLYYQEGDHTNIVDKKIIYFLERIRNEYLIDTTNLDKDFIKKLQHKTGKDEKDIQHLVYLINRHRKNYYQSIEEDLIEINAVIEKILN